MRAPLPFSNEEAEQTADWLESKLSKTKTSKILIRTERARRIVETLRWVATEQAESNTSTAIVLAAKAEVPVKADALVGALAEVANDAMNTQQRRDFEAGTLFAYWQAKTGNKHMTWTREKATRAQRFIRMFGLETCLWGVDGVMGHPDHNHNDGSSHHGFTSIFNFKDTERVEKLAEYARRRNKKKVHRMIERLIEQGYQPKGDS